MRAANLRRALTFTALAAALAACNATTGSAPSQQSAVWDSAIREGVDQQIAQSTARAANALETLAMIQRARTEPVARPVVESGLPEELRRLTTVEWSGPAIGLVKELAANIGYAFLESGNAPAVPAMVQVNLQDVPAAKAFEDIGLQSQAYATIIVDPNLRRVEFRHETTVAPLPSVAPAKASSPKEAVRKSAPVRGKVPAAK